jgi:hypothetical protein
MHLRFHKRIKVVPGIWINLNKSTPSISAGEGPFTVNVGKRGVRGTASLRGTGLSVYEDVPWWKFWGKR